MMEPPFDGWYDVEADPDDTAPDCEPPRCRYCGHEITTSPVIRLFSQTDPDAMWNCCEECIYLKEVT